LRIPPLNPLSFDFTIGSGKKNFKGKTGKHRETDLAKMYARLSQVGQHRETPGKKEIYIRICYPSVTHKATAPIGKVRQSVGAFFFTKTIPVSYSENSN
jgi:hypothetical protein